MFFPATAIVLGAAIFAAFAHGDSTYRGDHDSLRDAVYLNSSAETVRAFYRQARRSVRSDVGDKSRREYWLSRVELLAGRALQEDGDLQAARRHYDKALQHIEDAMEEGQFSDGLRVKSEVMGQMCLVMRGLGRTDYVLRNGLTVKSLARKAMGLDPQNVKAHIQVAGAFIYPSRIYGGDPKKGIEMMEGALALPSIEKDDRYNIFLGLGLAHAKLNNKEQAQAYFDKARILYPSNRFLKEQYGKLHDN